VLKVGETLVFDFCPRDPKSGFFFDITRTFCVGFVPNEVQKVYERVLEVQTRILDTLELSKPARYYDELCSQMFEDWGYPTPRKNPGTTKGYVHGLGHGLGLEVHEPPRLSCLSQKNEPLKPGFVFTVEPGLYFPDEGYGVRLEDVVAIHTDGRIENLTPFSKEILIPLK
jgi:Xaa-Pro aminopeptidase